MSKIPKRSVNLIHIEYQVSFHKASAAPSMSLIAGGANGGVAGKDVKVIFKTGQTVDICGINSQSVHQYQC
jgi:hypothetical protein